MTSNHIPISHQNGINEIELQYSSKYELIFNNYSGIINLLCFYFIEVDDFKLQITNTVTTMKLDLDIITNRVAQIELKLNEVISYCNIVYFFFKTEN